MNRTIIIGDVHSCYDELIALLEKCERKPSDEVVSIGDMVDRGPKPCEVVEFFSNGKNTCAILGNHEDKHIRIRKGEFGPSPSQFRTKEQMGTHYDKAVDYFETLPLWEEREGYLLVHAGARPNIPVHEQERNVLLRSKPGWWTTFNDTIKVIYGHYKHNVPHEENGTIGIDTGCYQGGKLTAFILPESRFVQVDAKTDYWGIVSNQYQKEWAKWREEKTGKPLKPKTKRTNLEIEGIRLHGGWVKEQCPETKPGTWIWEVLKLLDEMNQKGELQTLETAKMVVQGAFAGRNMAGEKTVAEAKPVISSKTIIYCDMDGVLADFTPGAIDLCSRILDESSDVERYNDSKTVRKAKRKIRNTLGPDWRPATSQDLEESPAKEMYFAAIGIAPGEFFAGLKPLSDAMELLWPYINNSNHEVKLLSAPIHIRRVYSSEKEATIMTAEDGKKRWAEEFLNPAPSEVLITPARFKQECAKTGGTPNIMIDDREENIRDWNAAGGIGILHTIGDSARTIEKLRLAGVKNGNLL